MTVMPCKERDIGRWEGKAAVYGNGFAVEADHEGNGPHAIMNETEETLAGVDAARQAADDALGQVPQGWLTDVIVSKAEGGRGSAAFVAVLVGLPAGGCVTCRLREVRRALRSKREYEFGRLVCADGNDLAVLLPISQNQPTEAERESALLAALNGLLEELREQLGEAGLRLYAGRAVYRPENLQGSWEQAKHARQVAELCGLETEIAAYDQLGVYSLLSLIPLGEAREQFLKRYLQPLRLADRKGSRRLAETLEMFLSCNGNVKLTSERMLVHYNTIVYRLEKVQAILGVSLDDPEDRLKLQLALKLDRIAESAAST